MTREIGGHGFTELASLLQDEEVEVLGLLPYSSNYVFLARVGKGDLLAVYKPQRGSDRCGTSRRGLSRRVRLRPTW